MTKESGVFRTIAWSGILIVGGMVWALHLWTIIVDFRQPGILGTSPSTDYFLLIASAVGLSIITISRRRLLKAGVGLFVVVVLFCLTMSGRM